MKDVIIIGAGGHGAELDEYIKYNQKQLPGKEYKVIGFLDDNPENYNNYQLSAPLLGNLKDHVVIPQQHYLIGIANLQYRRFFVEQFIAAGACFVTLIHCSAYISESATIGTGSIIGPNASIGPNVRIGSFTLINSRCSVGHDTHIGNYNFISPNVCFSGFTKIGDDNLFGINSATIPGIKIGNGNKIAAGMILDQDIADHTTVFYRYKEKIFAIPR